jgi:hypothetical protein
MRETQAEREIHSEIVPSFRLNFEAEKKRKSNSSITDKEALAMKLLEAIKRNTRNLFSAPKYIHPIRYSWVKTE